MPTFLLVLRIVTMLTVGGKKVDGIAGLRRIGFPLVTLARTQTKSDKRCKNREKFHDARWIVEADENGNPAFYPKPR